MFDFYNIELEALGQKLIWRDRSEPDVDTSEPLIKSEEDFGRLRPPRPGVDGRMPFVLESYRRYADEKKVCLVLNVRPDLVEEGPPEAIAENVRKLIGEGAGKGKFVLLMNLVPIGTPVEHVHAAVAAAKRFGAYPIASDLESRAFRMPEFPPFADWMNNEGLPV